MRNVKEISDLMARVQKVTFAAEDAGDSDETAEAVYQTLQWVLGNTDQDPMEYVAEDADLS